MLVDLFDVKRIPAGVEAEPALLSLRDGDVVGEGGEQRRRRRKVDVGVAGSTKKRWASSYVANGSAFLRPLWPALRLCLACIVVPVRPSSSRAESRELLVVVGGYEERVLIFR